MIYHIRITIVSLVGEKCQNIISKYFYRQKFDKNKIKIEVSISPVVHRQFLPIEMKESKNQPLLDQLGGQPVKANEKSVNN